MTPNNRYISISSSLPPKQSPHHRKKTFDYFLKLFPNPATELQYSTPFQLITAVMLSAQTTDKHVNKVTAPLFAKVKTPQDLLDHHTLSSLEKTIHGVNYYKTKAKHLLQTATRLAKHPLPQTVAELIQLPGIGEKTAKVIAHILFGVQVIPVDTHVHRVANRLGRTTTTTPLQTSKLLENIIPKHYKPIAHHCIVLFGRYHCTAKHPKCTECKLKKICKYFKG